MRAFWADPYLWIHAAGIAVLPLWLILCFLGLAAGDPILPSGLEILVVAIAGIAPIVWMQWEKPFCIYSLLAVSLKSSELTEDQRRILTLFQQRRSPIFIGVGAGVAFLILKQLYASASLVAPVTPIHNHALGLVVAIVSFLAANLFLQVPLSVLKVLLASDSDFEQAAPYDATAIAQKFFEPGLKVTKILPTLSD
ncbi:low-complexity tail membrane protein [filamentous cyanobacterium LEGE 11480]|uniref:Low-complexity tail membrane protein n=1 Tax=Romeriopsis navalis LEGE 11480 TaxID=2777977 RepID=A0A928VUX5_9CYAN|nr:low-complexity tail membrane protein [Romeriopsis navalis]MBE9032684.1 low-complexity tail membrane protein [Romeriopsis navalis LEGE 11480]